MRRLGALLRSPTFMAGCTVLFLSLVGALVGPLVASGDPLARTGLPFEPPSAHSWLGTNGEGQDMLLQLLFGLRSSLYAGVLAGAVATIIGTAVGLTAGYVGGYIDSLLTAVTNLFLVIPSLVVLILISASIHHRSLTLVGFIIGVTSWPWTARAVRAQAASLRTRAHVELARLNGQSVLGIITYQILPYILSYVFMAFVLQMASGVLSEAAISMLGLGPYDTVSLGRILNEAQQSEALINGNWWCFLPSATLISLITFSLYLINSSLETVFNPRLRQ